MSTTRLKEKSEVTRQAIAKHLEVLSDAGLLQSSRCGHERIWKLEPKGIKKAHEYLDRLSQHWDDALDHLKSLG